MKKIIISSVVAVIIAAGVGAWFFFKPSETDKLFEQCKEKVLSQLKAPSTAVFGEYEYLGRDKLSFQIKEAFYDEEKFTFDLDAQNSYGTMLRKKWKCSLNFKVTTGGYELDWVRAEPIEE